MAPGSNGLPAPIDDLKEELSRGAKQMIEDLAELEHEIWVNWSRDIARTESISMPRLKRWKALWKPYSQLTEEQKEEDRVLARRITQVQFKSAEKEMIKQGEEGSVSQ